MGEKRSRSDIKEEPSSDSGPFTIFASGLPYDGTEDDIRKFFDGCGEIAEIRCPKYHDSGRLRGYAHIDFATEEGMKEAVKKDGKYLGKRFVTVEIAKTARGNASTSGNVGARPANCNTVFVKGLPYEMDEAGFKAIFSEFGKVVSARISRWSNTGNSKGFGYIQFEHGFSADSAMEAYKAGKVILGGTASVVMDWDTGAPKASFRGPDGRNFKKSEESRSFKRDRRDSSGNKFDREGKRGKFKDAGVSRD